ncbi:hypothetical protein ACIQV2_31840 [Streptomyces globosus]|uniref:hypothetical protein n=1 Tax=Streptomyces globosus TaxID=68209 RepID=UPI0037F73E68
MKLTRDVSLIKWTNPVHEEAVYASGSTPLGRVVLTRRPGNRLHTEAAADALEDWGLSLEGEERLTAMGLASSTYASRKWLRMGIAVSVDDEACRATVSSAFLRTNRSVRLVGPTADMEFRPRGVGVVLLESGEPRGVRRVREWEFATPTASAVLAACLFEWAEMDYFLRTPGLRLL